MYLLNYLTLVVIVRYYNYLPYNHREKFGAYQCGGESGDLVGVVQRHLVQAGLFQLDDPKPKLGGGHLAQLRSKGRKEDVD